MKNGAAVFFAAFLALGGSWLGFVLAPQLQLGGAGQTSVLNSSDEYPLQPIGDATLGLQVYRANGCAACHTEQVQQDGVACDVVLTALGKNPGKVIETITSNCPINSLPSDWSMSWKNKWNDNSKFLLTFLHGVDELAADDIVQKITAAGGKAEIHIVATGADISRGWGVRHSVAADFLYDYPVQLGSLRAGPDLANIGVRAPDANWQLLHLYAPRSVTKNSTMPSFKFLFDVRKIGDAPSPDALNVPKEFAPADGYEVVPKTEAKQLVVYLLNLRANVPLYEAPFTAAPASTNSPADKK